MDKTKQKNWTHQHKSQACFLCQSLASHTVTAWLPTLVTNLSSLRLTYDCLHNRVHKQTDCHRHSSQTMSFHLSPSAHTTHTQCGLGEMLWQPLLTPHSRVSSWPTLRVTTRVHKQRSSLRQLFVYRLPETTHHRASTNTLHTSLTTLERRYDPFVIHDSNHRQHDMTGLQTVLASPNPDSTLSRSRGPSSIQVPSNRRQQTILVFKAIDESTKSSSSKQSTRAQSLRLPSDRREHKVFVFQAIDERSSTNTLNDEQLRDKDNWPRAQLTTHARTTPTGSASARSCAHIARTHAPHTHTQTQTATNCMPVSRTNLLSLLNGNRKKKEKKRKRKKNHTLTTQVQTTQTATRKRTSVTSVLLKKCLCVCASNVSVF